MTHTYNLPVLLHSKINSVFSSLCRVGVLLAVGLVLLSDGAYAFIGSTSFSRFTPLGRNHALPAEQDAVAQHLPMPSTVKGILFDMDGTLTDSDSLHFEAYRDTFLKVTPDFNGGTPITRDYYDEWMSGNSNAAIDKLKEEQTALWKSKEELYRKISTKMTPLPGLLAFLDRCRRAGLAMIIVTNAPRLDAEHTLQVLDLYDSFGKTMVIGCECARAKPHPDPYMEGLSRLGLEAEDCIAFEDSVNGATSAVSAGLFTIGVGEGAREKLGGVGVEMSVANFLDNRLSSTLGLGDLED